MVVRGGRRGGRKEIVFFFSVRLLVSYYIVYVYLLSRRTLYKLIFICYLFFFFLIEIEIVFIFVNFFFFFHFVSSKRNVMYTIRLLGARKYTKMFVVPGTAATLTVRIYKGIQTIHRTFSKIQIYLRI